VEIVVGNILLRPPRLGDLEAVVSACSDPEIPRFIPFVPVPYDEEAGRAWLAAVERAWLESDERTFAITDRGSGTFLGAVTIRLREGGTVGYWLDPQARGKGVMTEAVKAVVQWARSDYEINRLLITAHPDNHASQGVAERAGFVRAGTTDHRPAFRDGTTSAVLFELR
jgi:RimJ/RimL family protein N-acetyltransferase